jgi:hypothetical protein
MCGGGKNVISRFRSSPFSPEIDGAATIEMRHNRHNLDGHVNLQGGPPLQRFTRRDGGGAVTPRLQAEVGVRANIRRQKGPRCQGRSGY